MKSIIQISLDLTDINEAIDSHAFSVASHDLRAVLGEIVRRIH